MKELVARFRRLAGDRRGPRGGVLDYEPLVPASELEIRGYGALTVTQKEALPGK